MTTCATEGCGEPITWVTKGNWQHDPHSRSYARHYGHPPGGTNTTPPEELERDVKKVTLELLVDEMVKREKGMGCLTIEGVKYLIQCYADQAVEEATAKHNECDADYMAQLADLREQLDRALVSRFKVGDQVIDDDGWKRCVDRVFVAYILSGGSTVAENVLRLAPLETECQHEDSEGNPWVNQTFWGFNAFVFCPSCGESLTKETP